MQYLNRCNKYNYYDQLGMNDCNRQNNELKNGANDQS
jgi:hypothetical protein